MYIATGDGGGGNDDGTGHTPGTGNAQDTTNNLLGKILRIDVNGDEFPADANRNYAIPPDNPFKAGVGIPADDVGDDEIWAIGLRNPFRDSFDRLTGDLWIGDVGQGQREEIDLQPAGAPAPRISAGGFAKAIFRRRPLEGPIPPNFGPRSTTTIATPTNSAAPSSSADMSIAASIRLCRANISSWILGTPGTCDDNYWMFDPANPFGTVMNIDSLVENVGSGQFPVSFGEDAAGNLYIAYIGSGEVYRIATNQIPEPAAALLLFQLACYLLIKRRRYSQITIGRIRAFDGTRTGTRSEEGEAHVRTR